MCCLRDEPGEAVGAKPPRRTPPPTPGSCSRCAGAAGVCAVARELREPFTACRRQKPNPLGLPRRCGITESSEPRILLELPARQPAPPLACHRDHTGPAFCGSFTAHNGYGFKRQPLACGPWRTTRTKYKVCVHAGFRDVLSAEAPPAHHHGDEKGLRRGPFRALFDLSP